MSENKNVSKHYAPLQMHEDKLNKSDLDLKDEHGTVLPEK